MSNLAARGARVVRDEPYLVTRLDISTWTMHVFPLLSLRDTIRLHVTGNGLLMDRLQRTRISHHVPVTDVACDEVPLESMRSVPPCMRAVALRFPLQPSEETRELLQTVLARRPSIVKMRVIANRYSLPNVIQILGHAPHLSVLDVDVTYFVQGVSNLPSLERNAALSLSQVQHLRLRCMHPMSLSAQDARCLHGMKSLRSLEAVQTAATAICQEVSGFTALQSLRLDSLSLTGCKVSVNALPSTLTSLRMRFVTFIPEGWLHGSLPPRLLRLSLHTMFLEDVPHPSDVTTSCPPTLTRLSIHQSLMPLLDFGRDPAAFREMVNLTRCSLVGANNLQRQNAFIMNTPPSCTALALLTKQPRVDLIGRHVQWLRLTVVDDCSIDSPGLSFPSDSTALQTITIRLSIDIDVALIVKLCTALKETKANIHVVWHSFFTPALCKTITEQASLLSSRDWFTFNDIEGERLVFYRGKQVTVK